MGTPGALSIPTGMYTRPSLTSPMAQLTCLLPSHSNENLTNVERMPKEIPQKSPVLPPVPPPGKFILII